MRLPLIASLLLCGCLAPSGQPRGTGDIITPRVVRIGPSSNDDAGDEGGTPAGDGGPPTGPFTLPPGGCSGTLHDGTAWFYIFTDGTACASLGGCYACVACSWDADAGEGLACPVTVTTDAGDMTTLAYSPSDGLLWVGEESFAGCNE